MPRKLNTDYNHSNMKIFGIALILFQVLAYASGNSNFENESFAFILGYNLIGIAGVILLIAGSNNKKEVPNQNNESKKEPPQL